MVPITARSSMAFRTPFNQADFSGNFGSNGAGLYGRDNGAVFYGKVHPGGTHLQYVASVSTGLRSSAAVGPNQRDSLKYAGSSPRNLLNDEDKSRVLHQRYLLWDSR